MTDAPRIDLPQPGFFRTRLVKGGPFVPARIWVDDSIPERPAVMLAEVNGKPGDVWRWWPSLAGNAITKDEFDHLTCVAEWAQQSAPDAPEATPNKPINLANQPAFEPVRR